MASFTPFPFLNCRSTPFRRSWPRRRQIPAALQKRPAVILKSSAMAISRSAQVREEMVVSLEGQRMGEWQSGFDRLLQLRGLLCFAGFSELSNYEYLTRSTCKTLKDQRLAVWLRIELFHRLLWPLPQSNMHETGRMSMMSSFLSGGSMPCSLSVSRRRISQRLRQAISPTSNIIVHLLFSLFLCGFFPRDSCRPQHMVS